MKNNMRLLVLGSYYSSNLGDGVICECVAARLKQHFPEAEVKIMDLMAREGFAPAQEHPMEHLRKREERKLLRKWATRLGWDKTYSHECYCMDTEAAHFEKLGAEECDAVIFAGGQMFMDSYALRLESVVNSQAKRGVPILFNACGAGPAYSRKISARLKKALGDPCVKWVSTRDDTAAIDGTYLSGGRSAESTFDPALWSGEVYGITKAQSGVVGLGVMYPYNVDFYAACRFWEKLIPELERRGVRWKMFVNGSGTDVAFARYIHSRIPGLLSFESCLAAVPGTPRELMQTVAGFESIISFRLHSHIIAASLDIPSVALVWDGKLNFFFEKIGHPERCCTPKDSPEKVLAALDRAREEGYDQKLLEEQKQFADRLLYRAVCEAVEKQ